MDKKEYYKFFCGFFSSAILILISILLFGVMPFSVKGFVFDYSVWTMMMVFSSFFVAVCAYSGWERRIANKISITVISFLMAIILLTGSNFIGSDFSFDNNYAASSEIVGGVVEKDVMEIEEKNGLEILTYNMVIGSDRGDSARSVAIDKDNNVYVAGHFSGVINLDQDNFKRTALGGVGDTTDIYVVKYGPKKEFIWGFTIGSVGNDKVNLIRVENDNLYLAGSIGGKIDIDSGEGDYTLDAGVGQDGFIAKYDLDGKVIWGQRIGNPEIIPFIDDDIRFEDIVSLAVDKEDNVIVAGYFDGILDFKDVNGNVTSFSNPNQKKARDAVVIKYDKDGNYLTAFSLLGEGRKEIRGLLIDDDSNMYIAGIFNSKISLDNANSKKISYTAGGKDIFIAKYGSDNSLLWSKKWGSAGNDDIPVNGMIFDKHGKLLLGGMIGGYVNMDGFKKSTNGLQDIFWARMDKEGKVEQVNVAGGAGNDGLNAVNVDSLNNVYLGGYFSGIVNFDSKKKNADSVAYPISSGEATDAFLAKYDEKGGFLWVNSFGGDVSLKEEHQSINSLVVDKLDYPISVGDFYKSLEFNSSEDLNITARGMMDGVLIKYDPEGGIR